MFFGSVQIISRLDSQSKFQMFTLVSGRHKTSSPELFPLKLGKALGKRLAAILEE